MLKNKKQKIFKKFKIFYLIFKFKILCFIITKALYLLLYPYDITDNENEKEKTKEIINSWYNIICYNIESKIY